MGPSGAVEGPSRGRRGPSGAVGGRRGAVGAIPGPLGAVKGRRGPSGADGPKVTFHRAVLYSQVYLSKVQHLFPNHYTLCNSICIRL